MSQPPPKSPQERREQAKERQRWLEEWIPEIYRTEHRVPTIKRTCDDLRAKFGFVLETRYVTDRLRYWREKLEGQDSRATGRPSRDDLTLRQLAAMLRRAGLDSITLHLRAAARRPPEPTTVRNEAGQAGEQDEGASEPRRERTPHLTVPPTDDAIKAALLDRLRRKRTGK